MNSFMDDYIAKLRGIEQEGDIKDLYRWFWDRPEQIQSTVEEINRTLSLSGEVQLQPDMPCLAIGGLKGVLLVNANPGWREDLNHLEDSYCRRSKDAYIDLMLNFFERHPEVVGERVTWWNSALSWVRLLDDWELRFGALDGKKKWAKAHQSKLVGGWELVPFHSSKDGVSGLMRKVPWLRTCAIESLRAAIRIGPEVLFVVSKKGWQFVRFDVLPEARWQDGTVGSGRMETNISYAKVGRQTEIIAIGRQIFSAPRNFTNQDVLSRVNEFRDEA